MQKEDIQSSLLQYPTLTQQISVKNVQQAPTGQLFHTINILDLDQYRIKSHCHYDPSLTGTTDYSIFQIEIVSDELQRFYQGRYILEIWNKNGERIYQKVLKDEITQWKLHNNTFLFKGASESPLIYLIWLNEKKMIAIKHPYDDNKEVDMAYFDNHLIVAQQFNFRFAQINPEEVQTTISQFQNPDEGNQPLLEKEFSGIIHNERIFQIVAHPYKSELIFICVAENYQISYYKLFINKGSEKRYISLQRMEVDEKQMKNRKNKLDKKQLKLLEVLADVQQIHMITKGSTPYLLVLRKNQVLEIVESFAFTVYVEQRLNLTKILPSFGEKITLQFSDGSIIQSPSMDKLADKNYITDADYYRQQTMPPQGTTLYEIHNNLHFYQDSLIINQSLFLLRDNVVLIVDTFTKQVIQKFYQKHKILSLHKLRTQSEDDKGYKVSNFKVVAVNKNGTLQVFTKQHIHDTSNNEWIRTEIGQTAISQQKESVYMAFQNQTSINCLYIVSQSSQQDSLKIYQMLFNTQIIELNLKLRRGDHISAVNSVSRQREILAVVDSKYLIVYRNDKGNLIKLYQMNHTRFEFRDQITPQTIFYFSKDYILAISKSTVFKVNLSSSQIEQSKLQKELKNGGSCFIDATCFYFLTQGDDNGQCKLAVADTTMIESSYQDTSKDEVKNAVIDRNNQKGINKLMYPTWDFKNSIKRLDYDEYNSVINLQFSNFEIVQVPMLHRNTLHFMGMGERSFYLITKKHGQYLYALDKNNYLSCWSMVNGQLISKTYVTSADYKFYESDKDLYDKGWFSYSLIYRPNQASPNSLEEGNLSRTYKIVDIDERGNIFEWLTFTHPVQKHMETHLYFNTDFNMMVELLINKNRNNEATYNLYQLENALTQKWKFVQCLSSPENPQALLEWHHKSLFPFTMNLKTMQAQSDAITQKYEVYKYIDKERVKILNTIDGIEMVYNVNTQTMESYMALQYSFANTKDSFYDKKCGHFYIQEVTSRLQNFYESVRRHIYLHNKTNFKLRSLDVSARDYKYKYLIEHSYTLLDYQFFQQFIKDKPRTMLKTIKQMSNEHIQRILHNIFPENSNNLLHVIAESDIGFESVDYLTQLAKKEGFVIPFLLNAEENTPLDITVLNRDFKQTNSLIKMLSKTPMDHHSRLISHLIPKLIEMNLPALEKYFDKRRFQTGVCKTLTLGRINIYRDQDFKTVPTTLLNENEMQVRGALMNPKFKEQSINLEVLDVPLHQFKGTDIGLKQQQDVTVNDYEIKLVKSLANTEIQELFGQKTVRAFIDFLWPTSRRLIIKNLFLPYLAFILYYMIYLIVLKKLTITYETDPAFFDFTAGTFTIYDALFKVILFLGCFYFFYQDFLQIKNFTNNPIVLWSYANIFPLSLMIFIIAYDLFIDSNNTTLEKTFYSAASFFIWIRVIHLLKCFPQTSYLLRMGAEILHRMRFLIAFIVISLLAFGFTFYFVSDYQASVDGFKTETPFQGFVYMFQVMIGQYDAEHFNNIYLSILLVVVSFFNFFFIFTLIVALSVVSFSKDSDIYSNEAYQDKASLISLYSYLMTEQAVREPAKKYLLIATVTEGKKSKGKNGSSFGGFGAGQGNESKTLQAKMLKNMDRRLNNLTTKVEKTLKDISDRLDSVSQQQRND